MIKRDERRHTENSFMSPSRAVIVQGTAPNVEKEREGERDGWNEGRAQDRHGLFIDPSFTKCHRVKKSP